MTVFLIAFFTPSTDKDPAGIAGLSASRVALCAASMILSEAVHAGGLQIRRLPSIFIGICGMASAYLWIAGEADIHPRNPALPLTISLLFAAVAVIFVGPVIALSSSPQSHDQSHGEEGDE